jgi:hypothetical protein
MDILFPFGILIMMWCTHGLTAWIVNRIAKRHLPIYTSLGQPDKGYMIFWFHQKNLRLLCWMFKVRTKEIADQQLILGILGIRLLWVAIALSFVVFYKN